MGRDAFTFFASYRTATAKLDDAVRLAVYDAIMDYALLDIEPEFDDVVVEAIFNLIRPTVDANNRKRDGGARGGSRQSETPAEASCKHTASIPQACGKDVASVETAASKDTATDIVIDKDKDKDIDKDSIPPSIPPGGKRVRTNEDLDAFEAFWREYPRKDSRQNALKEWLALNPSRELAEEIIAHVHQRKQLWEWKRSKGQYVPYAGSFLSQRRWEDDLANRPRGDPAKKFIDYTQHDYDSAVWDAIALNLDEEVVP